MAGTLVIQPLPGIGDMVWHLPHLEAIARTSPGGSIAVLTKRRSRADELFAGSPFVRQVLWLERAQSGERLGRHDGLLGGWRLAHDLRAHAFDSVWILHDSTRYALAAWLARVVGTTTAAGHRARAVRTEAARKGAQRRRHGTRQKVEWVRSGGEAVW